MRLRRPFPPSPPQSRAREHTHTHTIAATAIPRASARIVPKHPRERA